jgi:hypothetical protein
MPRGHILAQIVERVAVGSIWPAAALGREAGFGEDVPVPPRSISAIAMTDIANIVLRPRTDGLPRTALALGSAVLLLMAPSLWNGYPLVYYDSVDYVKMPFVWSMPIYRTAGYWIFPAMGRIAHSLWAVVLVQSLLVAYVAYEGLRCFLPRAPRRALVAIMALAALVSGLPWFTSEIMPDAMTGVVVLATATLAFGDGALGLRRQAALSAILALAIAVHTSHIALAAGLVLCLALVARVARQGRGWPLPRPRLRTILLAFVVALGFAAGSNWLMTGRLFLLQDNAVLTLGLFVQDGLAQDYLAEVCKKPGPHPRLCAVRRRLPRNANTFLWHDKDFDRLGGWTKMDPEAHRIVTGAIEAHPLTYAWDSIKLTLQQLVMVKTADGVQPMRYLIGDTIAKYYPRENRSFLTSHQQRGIDFSRLNAIQVPLLLLATAALLPAFWMAWRRRDAVAVGLIGTVVLAMLGNAFICGALSNPNDRYQSRIAWLAMFALAVAAARLTRRRPGRYPAMVPV